MIEGTPARLAMLISIRPLEAALRRVLLEVDRRPHADREGDDRGQDEQPERADEGGQDARVLGLPRRVRGEELPAESGEAVGEHSR
jgi:hypothetical protein